MLSFFESLWSSVFTPGTTPALILATNLSLLLLQITLVILYFLTYSIHFIVLNVICACLWGLINWFVREVEAFQREKDREDREGKIDSVNGDVDVDGKVDSGDGDGKVDGGSEVVEKEESKKEI